MIKALATGINTLAANEVQGPAGEVQKQQLQKAGDALANALGPVSKFFERGLMLEEFPRGAFYEVLPLKPLVKKLSLAVMRALLESDKLQIGLEEEVYYLLGAYLHQSPLVPEANRMKCFKELVKMIRFHHISVDYLANVVTCCPLAYSSGMAPSFLRSALVYRDANKRVAKEREIDLGAIKREIAPQEWIFSAKILMADLIKLENNDNDKGSIFQYVGVAGGYPVALCLKREKDKLAAYVHPLMPRLPAEPFDECLGRRVGFFFNLKLSSKEFLFEGLMNRTGWGRSDWFNRPWDEVVCENSKEFNDKKELEVALAMKLEKED